MVRECHMEKIKSGMKSLFTIANNIANGVDQIVPEEIKVDRLSKCNSCPHLLKTRQCGDCFCFVDLKTKYKQEECPLGKWSSHE